MEKIYFKFYKINKFQFSKIHKKYLNYIVLQIQMVNQINEV